MNEAMSGISMPELQSENLRLLKKFISVCEKYDIWYVLAYGTMLGAVRHKGFIPWDRDIDVYIKISDAERLRSIMLNENHIDSIYSASGITPKYSGSQDVLTSTIHDEAHLDIYPLFGAPSDLKEQKKFAKKIHIIQKILKSKYVDIRLCLPSNKKKVRIAKLIDSFISDSRINKIYRYFENKYPFATASHYVTLVNYGRAKDCVDKYVYESRIQVKFEDVDVYIPTEYDKYLTQIYGDYMTPVKF